MKNKGLKKMWEYIKKVDKSGYQITMGNEYEYDNRKSFEDWVELKETIKSQTITITINYDNEI